MRHAKTSQANWIEGGKGSPDGGEAVQALTKMPPSPKRVQGRAREIWRETGKLLVAAGMLARPDLGLLERYAGLRAYAESVAAQLLAAPLDFGSEEQTSMRAYQIKVSSELRQIEQALGLNPIARARMGKHQPPAQEDALGELRARRQALREKGAT